MQNHIVFCESNLKGGIRCALAPKTLVLGPNGSGKSSVCNTVELALTGKVSDMVGRREVAKEIELQALAPGRKGELIARAAFASGGDAVWRAGGKTKKAKHTFSEKDFDKDAVLPLRPVYDAILGSVETARKFFLQYAVGAVTDVDVLRRIPESLHSYYRNATLTGTLSTQSAVDRLLFAMEHAKKQAREWKDKAKAAEAVGNDSAQGLAPLPTEAEEAALRAAEKEAQKRADGLKEIIAKNAALAGAEQEAKDLDAKLVEAERAYLAAKTEADAAQAALAALPQPEAATAEVVALRQVIVAHANAGKGVCLCCGQTPNRSAAEADFTFFWQKRLAGLDGYLAAQAAAQAAYDAAKARFATAQMVASQKMSEGQALYERRKTLAAILAEGGGLVPPPGAVEEADREVAALREKLRAVDVLKASWATASKAKDSVNDAQSNATEWTKLHEACGEAVLSLLDGGVAGFIAKVQSFLPDRDRFALTLREGERAVFQFGLMKQGALYTALSGAEWARVTAAMAGACIPDVKKLSVIIPEERAFDAQTLYDVLTAFTDLDSQVIVTSPVAPTAMPSGWLVIDTTKDEHRQSAPPPRLPFEPPAVPTGEMP